MALTPLPKPSILQHLNLRADPLRHLHRLPQPQPAAACQLLRLFLRLPAHNHLASENASSISRFRRCPARALRSDPAKSSRLPRWGESDIPAGSRHHWRLRREMPRETETNRDRRTEAIPAERKEIPLFAEAVRHQGDLFGAGAFIAGQAKAKLSPICSFCCPGNGCSAPLCRRPAPVKISDAPRLAHPPSALSSLPGVTAWRPQALETGFLRDSSKDATGLSGL